MGWSPKKTNGLELNKDFKWDHKMLRRVHIFISPFHGWLGTLFNSLMAYRLKCTRTTSSSSFSFLVGGGSCLPSSRVFLPRVIDKSRLLPPLCKLQCPSLLRFPKGIYLVPCHFRALETTVPIWSAKIPGSCLEPQGTHTTVSTDDWHSGLSPVWMSEEPRASKTFRELRMLSPTREYICSEASGWSECGCLQNRLCWALWTHDWIRRGGKLTRFHGCFSSTRTSVHVEASLTVRRSERPHVAGRCVTGCPLRQALKTSKNICWEGYSTGKINKV